MTVIFVLCTLLTFLGADYIVQRSRAARKARLACDGLTAAMPASLQLPADAELFTNHTWIRRDPLGNTVIGLDDLLARAIGAAEEILLPEPGTVVTPGTTDIGLTARGCSLGIAPPVHGRVVEVNASLLSNPALAKSDPYGQGWLIKVRPAAAHIERTAACIVQRPAEWLREQADLMREFFLQASGQVVPVTMQDGGETVEGALQQFDSEVWSAFRLTFATLRAQEPVHAERGSRPS
jgi:glycine cleavage system H protein